MNIIRLTKEQKDAIAWLKTMAAHPRENRPALEGVRVTENGMIAANGFALGFVLGAPEGLAKDTTYTMHKPTKDAAIAEANLEQKFPDLSAISPKDEPKARFCVNPQLLAKTLKGFGEYARVSVHADRLVIANEEKFAVVMLREMRDAPYNDVTSEEALK